MSLWHWEYDYERPSELANYVGQRITAIEVGDSESLFITLEGGKTIRVYDNGQSCCERRYMSTDDDLQSLRGKVLAAIEAKPAPGRATVEYGEHEIAFLEVKTTDGDSATFAFHNEHNGYYGGFGLAIAEVALDSKETP